MADITAADVKRLRELTGAGMMDCKKALTEADGDFDAAVEVLRIKGAAKAAKRGAERTAGNGLVTAVGNTMVELACETDFVAKNEQFQALAADIATAAEAAGTGELDDILTLTLADGRSVKEAIDGIGGVIGEKIELRRAARFDGAVATYLHRKSPDLPPQVGVLVSYTGTDAEAARGAAMQVAAMRPQYATAEEIPADILENERRIAEATAREEGKPEQALPKIIEGRVNGFIKDVVLTEQSSVTDSKRTVGAVLGDSGVAVTAFARFEVGQS
jgi:elongation factor Ts